MKDVFSIIQQLTGQHTYLPQGPFKEEHIKELQPVEYVSSYYQNPMQAFHDPWNDQKYIIEWKNEKGNSQTGIQKNSKIQFPFPCIFKSNW